MTIVTVEDMPSCFIYCSIPRRIIIKNFLSRQFITIKYFLERVNNRITLYVQLFAERLSEHEGSKRIIVKRALEIMHLSFFGSLLHTLRVMHANGASSPT